MKKEISIQKKQQKMIWHKIQYLRMTKLIILYWMKKKKEIIDILGSVNITEKGDLQFKTIKKKSSSLGETFYLTINIINDDELKVDKKKSKIYIFEDVGKKYFESKKGGNYTNINQQNLFEFFAKNVKKNITEIDAKIREFGKIVKYIESVNSIHPDKLIDTFYLKNMETLSIEEKIFYFTKITEHILAKYDANKSFSISKLEIENYYKLIISVSKLLDELLEKFENNSFFLNAKKQLNLLKEKLAFDPIKIFIQYPDFLGKTNFDGYFSFETKMEPYEHQINMTQNVYDNMTNGFFIAYTTPTGSGKTMSCISLAKLINILNNQHNREKKFKLIFACNSQIVKNQIGTYLLHSGINHLETKNIENFQDVRIKEEQKLNINFKNRVDSEMQNKEKKMGQQLYQRNFDAIKKEVEKNIKERDTSQINNMRAFYFSKYRTPKRMRGQKQEKVKLQKEMDYQLSLKYGPYFIFQDDILGTYKDIKKTYEGVLRLEDKYFDHYRQSHVIVTDTESARDIIKDLERKYDIVLFFDEPTMGADQFNSEELIRNCKLLSYLPERTILSSATIFNIDNKSKLYHLYSKKNGNKQKPLVIKGGNLQNGCLLKGYDKHIFPPFSMVKNKEELQKAIDVLEKNMFFKKTCTFQILKDLHDKMQKYGHESQNLSQKFDSSKKWNHNFASQEILSLLGKLKTKTDGDIQTICDYNTSLIENDTIDYPNIFTDWTRFIHGTTLLTTTDIIKLIDGIYPLFHRETNGFRFKMYSEEYFRHKNIIDMTNVQSRITFSKNTYDTKDFESHIDGQELSKKLFDLFKIGVGVYSKKLGKNYLDAVEENLITDNFGNSNLIFLLGDDSIIYGADFSINRIFIDDKFSQNHSIESIMQVIGRAGRGSFSAEAYIPNSVMCRFYEYIIENNDELHNETFNINFELDLLNANNYKKSLLDSLYQFIIEEQKFSESCLRDLIELIKSDVFITDRYEAYITYCRDNIKKYEGSSLIDQKCGNLIKIKKEEYGNMYNLLNDRFKQYNIDKAEIYVRLFRKITTSKIEIMDIDVKKIAELFKKINIKDTPKIDVGFFNSELKKYENELRSLKSLESEQKHEQKKEELTEDQKIYAQQRQKEIQLSEEKKQLQREIKNLETSIKNLEEKIVEMGGDDLYFSNVEKEEKIVEYDEKDIIQTREEFKEELNGEKNLEKINKLKDILQIIEIDIQIRKFAPVKIELNDKRKKKEQLEKKLLEIDGMMREISTTEKINLDEDKFGQITKQAKHHHNQQNESMEKNINIKSEELYNIDVQLKEIENSEREYEQIITSHEQNVENINGDVSFLEDLLNQKLLDLKNIPVELEKLALQLQENKEKLRITANTEDIRKLGSLKTYLEDKQTGQNLKLGSTRGEISRLEKNISDKKEEKNKMLKLKEKYTSQLLSIQTNKSRLLREKNIVEQELRQLKRSYQSLRIKQSDQLQKLQPSGIQRGGDKMGDNFNLYNGSKIYNCNQPSRRINF